MQPWLVRGVAMAVVNAVAQTVVAKLEVDDPSGMTSVRPLVIAALVGVAGLWGGLDGWLRHGGRRRGMTWFWAALFGGELAGLLGVIGQGAFVDQTGVSALGSALTGGAAFTALLILVPAGLGLAVGSRLAATPEDEADGAEPATAGAAPVTSGAGLRAARGAEESAARRPSPRPRRTRTGETGSDRSGSDRPTPEPAAERPRPDNANETTQLSGSLIAELPQPSERPPLPRRTPRAQIPPREGRRPS